MDAQTVNLLLKILGDETRFQIVRLLLDHDLCVGALARMLKISKAAVSQHLKILREAGLVKGEKRGYWTHYAVERGLLKDAALFMHEMAERLPSGSYVCLRKKEEPKNMGRRMPEMCKNCCKQPEKLKLAPKECTPEQIKECHGEEKDHPCEKDDQP